MSLRNAILQFGTLDLLISEKMGVSAIIWFDASIRQASVHCIKLLPLLPLLYSLNSSKFSASNQRCLISLSNPLCSMLFLAISDMSQIVNWNICQKKECVWSVTWMESQWFPISTPPSSQLLSFAAMAYSSINGSSVVCNCSGLSVDNETLKPLEEPVSAATSRWGEDHLTFWRKHQTGYFRSSSKENPRQEDSSQLEYDIGSI